MTHAPEHTILVPPALADARLDVVLSRTLGWSRGQAQHAVADGRVYVGDKRERVAGVRVAAGLVVRVLPEAPDRTQVGGGGVAVVLQTPGLLVVDKPAGLPSQQPPRGGDALDRRVLREFATAGHVHRLDRDVSGLVVFGLGPAATSQLAAQFRTHTARRRYLALVRTAMAPQPQTITEPIAELHPGRMAVSPTGMPATTRVTPLVFDPDGQLALVLAELETGRTHQVRVHLAWAIGPIAGDVQYGDLPRHARERIALHAAVLDVGDPATGRPVHVELPPPDAFWAVADQSPWPLPTGWQGAPTT